MFRVQVVGHVKTVIILMGGCLFFGDDMPMKKLAGISVAMSGIVWYSQVRPGQPRCMHSFHLPSVLWAAVDCMLPGSSLLMPRLACVQLKLAAATAAAKAAPTAPKSASPDKLAGEKEPLLQSHNSGTQTKRRQGETPRAADVEEGISASPFPSR